MTPEQISAMVAGSATQSAPLSTYLSGVTSANPFYQPIVNTYNAGQGLTNWGAGASPEAISQGTANWNANRNTLASLVAQANAWRPPQPAQQQMGMYGNYAPGYTAQTGLNPYTGLYGPSWGGGRSGGYGGRGYGDRGGGPAGYGPGVS
jgi:hypothetical protein